MAQALSSSGPDDWVIAPSGQDDWAAPSPPPPAPPTSSLGSFGRGIERGALPAAGGLAAATAVAGAAQPILAPIAAMTGPAAPLVEGAGSLAAGIAGYYGGSSLVNKAQDWALNEFPGLRRTLGQTPAQQQADVTSHPYASMAGEIAPNLALLRPGAVETAVKEGAPAIQRILANPWTGRGLGAGFMGAQEAVQENADTGHVDPWKVGISAAAGAAMNKPTRLGQGIIDVAATPQRVLTNIASGRPANAPAQAPEAPPLAAQSQDDWVAEPTAGAPTMTPEAVLQHAQNRADYLKSVGSAQPAMGSIPASQGRLHTPEEIAESQFLKANGHDLQAVAEAYGINISPEVASSTSQNAPQEADDWLTDAGAPAPAQGPVQQDLLNIADHLPSTLEASTPPITQLSPDIETIARQIDPLTFQQHDALTQRQDSYRQWLQDLNDERDQLPASQGAQAQIDSILGKVGGVEDRLTKTAASRLADARAVFQGDTPDMTFVRGQLLNIQHKLWDLAPNVQKARQDSQNQLNLLHGNVTVTQDVGGDTIGAPETGANIQTEATPRDLRSMQDTSAWQEQPEMQRLPRSVNAELAEDAPSQSSAETERQLPLVQQRTAETGKPKATPMPDVQEPEGANAPSGLQQPEISGMDVPELSSDTTQETPKAAIQIRRGAVRPVAGTGDLNTRGLSEGIEAKAIENRLTYTFGDLPEYRAVSMADQAIKAEDFLDKDYDAAKEVALGRKPPPRGLLPESVLVAVERRATKEGDVDTIRRLATNSGLSVEATTMGQRLRTLGERDQSSPVGAIKSVQDAREAALKSRNIDPVKAKTDVVKQIKSEIKRTAASSKRPTWESFISQITCR